MTDCETRIMRYREYLDKLRFEVTDLKLELYKLKDKLNMADQADSEAGNYIEKLETENSKLKNQAAQFKRTLMALCRCGGKGMSILTICDPCRYKELFNKSWKSV